MQTRDIVVIGTSAGGVQALSTIVKDLAQNFDAAVLIVSHTSPYQRSVLPRILSRAGKLDVAHAVDREEINPGKVYVAPPDRHLVVEAGRLRLTRGPKENRFRPAIDPLFRSAANEFGARVVGVILSGALDDGTAGLWAIKDRGGIAVVQDPSDAEQSSMPQSALNNVEVDYCVPVSEIGRLLLKLSQEPVIEKGGTSVSRELQIETKIALEGDAAELDVTQLGELSEFTCPECHGVLIRIQDGKLQRFRCHTGHAFSTGSLLAELTEYVEDSLWTAIRAVEERVRLLKHLAQHAADISQSELVQSITSEIEDAERRADLARQVVLADRTDAGR
jgi:two-component system, chemotaxis family, protein-glutamate methylesterase/glutaminase